MAAKKSKTSQPTSIVFDDAKYRAQDDMRTLTRAREIEMDGKRMAAARKEAEHEMKKVQMVLGKKPITSKR